MGRIWVLALIGGILFGAAAKGDQIGDLAGRWHSSDLTTSDPNEEIPEEIRLVIDGDANGFQVTLDLGHDRLDSVGFAPSPKKGVYSVAESGGLFSLFSGETSANPLEGEPLVWARTTEHGIAIYHLKIDRDGNFHLSDLRCERVGDSVALRYSAQRSGKAPLLIEATLSGEG